LFGLVERWKRRRPNRLERLAARIEALNERDNGLDDETAAVGRLRLRGAAELYAICRGFVKSLNSALVSPVIILDPSDYLPENFTYSGPNILQINLRGRLLQIDFAATEDLYSTDDFRRRYTLQGTVRSFNQELLASNIVDEQTIYYCPEGAAGQWYFFNSQTYRTGRVTADFLAAELERIL
jgi:hypothetical protein